MLRIFLEYSILDINPGNNFPSHSCKVVHIYLYKPLQLNLFLSLCPGTWNYSDSLDFKDCIL